jgi:hypothetical protein
MPACEHKDVWILMRFILAILYEKYVIPVISLYYKYYCFLLCDDFFSFVQ